MTIYIYIYVFSLLFTERTELVFVTVRFRTCIPEVQVEKVKITTEQVA